MLKHSHLKPGWHIDNIHIQGTSLGHSSYLTVLICIINDLMYACNERCNSVEYNVVQNITRKLTLKIDDIEQKHK